MIYVCSFMYFFMFFQGIGIDVDVDENDFDGSGSFGIYEFIDSDWEFYKFKDFSGQD